MFNLQNFDHCEDDVLHGHYRQIASLRQKKMHQTHLVFNLFIYLNIEYSESKETIIFMEQHENCRLIKINTNESIQHNL